eukprot:5087205-Lingulodinium_polyedra.AAC.1
MIGVWADGSEHMVAEVTVGEFRLMKETATSSSRGKTGALWRGTSKEGHSLYIAKRKDRNQNLTVLFEKNEQILQVSSHK